MHSVDYLIVCLGDLMDECMGMLMDFIVSMKGVV